jgi:amino acid adenylation domain-containing protein
MDTPFTSNDGSPDSASAIETGDPARAANAFIPRDRLAAVAAATPDAVALVAACGTLSYAELDRQAARLAGYLAGRGLRPGALVGVCIDRSFDQIVATLAAWKAGCAFLPLDPAWPDARLTSIIADADCAMVVSSGATAARIAVAVRELVVVDRDAAAIAAAAPLVAPAVAANDLAYVIYTSGSTGAPKGVELSHANLANLIAWHDRAFAVTATDRATHLAGLGFDAAIWEIWPYLCAGATVLLVPDAVRTSDLALRQWLIEQKITVSFVPTALAEQMVAADWPADTALRILLTGADRLHVYPRAGLPFALVNNYGPTECTVVATSGVVAPTADADRLPPIGRPIDHTPIYILDADGHQLAAAEVGELHIGGDSVGRGYRGRPDLTAERFLADPFAERADARMYRTGDLAALLPDGQIAFHGRIDDQVKIRGHRVEPEEAAAALRDHSAVRSAIVVARAEGDGETHLVAYVVAGDAAITAEALRAFLAERLPEYMVPDQFVRIDALPLNASGKLDRAALPAPSAENALASEQFAAPETPAQQRLAEIIVEVLGRGPVGIDDNFFLLGGHSLLGTQVVLRAGEAFGVDITLRHLFQAPTVRTLATLIEELLLEMLEAMSDDEASARAAE